MFNVDVDPSEIELVTIVNFSAIIRQTHAS